MSRRFMSINLAKPMETVEQFPFVLCAWPSFADQPYINNYRIYDDRVGETTRFTYRPNHEWYWFPRQKPTEVSMLKCYDSVTEGSVSRWSFHTACIDPTAPADARCRKNVVVRSFAAPKATFLLGPRTLEVGLDTLPMWCARSVPLAVPSGRY